ncbi:hypothetical protein GPECTOR_46g275 [Gonium pectorale]|uniref:Nuclear nucleic acid-binding protein C1D n=1 Tax=Gonium pectorale TaxID=33097 RepID=A0A150G8L7_GONPE|nr:hypothetical protein GPECTOR_46g275 [Gonium pectorale]|eukprot:KXZ46206.1 hypothetical protein GPECTOR_46g275 [Gonium pectorale]
MASNAAGVGAGCTTSGAATPAPVGSLLNTLVPGGVLELPEDIQIQLRQFKELVTELKSALDAASQHVAGPSELAAIPAPLERARLCLSLAKAVNALHHVYMRVHGRDPFAPPPGGGASVGRQELDRVRQYGKKVSRAVNEAELRASRPVLSLDVAAASRFIDAAIPDLTAEQRQQLKRTAQAVEAKRGTNKKPRGGSAAKGRGGEEAEAAADGQAGEEGEGGGEAEEEAPAGGSGGASGPRKKGKALGKGSAAAAVAGKLDARAAAEQFLATLTASATAEEPADGLEEQQQLANSLCFRHGIGLELEGLTGSDAPGPSAHSLGTVAANGGSSDAGAIAGSGDVPPGTAGTTSHGAGGDSDPDLATAAAAAGASGSSGASGAPGEAEADGMCCVCLSERAAVGFVHADVVHCCLCGGCRDAMARLGRLAACPICKEPPLRLLRVVGT